MELIKLNPLTPEFLESIGFYWHTDLDSSAYISDEVVVISENEAEAYYEAVNELYEMFVEAGEYVIENNLFHELNIPYNLVEIIKKSWDEDMHWHIYSRFDLAGGVDGKPIKLIEFNADTPTSLVESSLIQWAILKANNLSEEAQFNGIYEAIRDNFKRLIVGDGDIEEFEEKYSGWRILFSSVKDNIEDENTVRLLESIAKEAGFNTEFAYIDEIEFSGSDGVFYDGQNYQYLFKLIPWEAIAIEESELASLLTEITLNQKAIILNPAYTLLFQSKAFMKILWNLYPNHPLLLETSFEPLENKAYVEKKAFGREGANTKIVNENNEIVAYRDGEYEGFNSVFQEYYEFNREEDNYYQAGVFFAYEGCGVSFRRGGEILDNYSKFVGHIIK